MWMTEGEIVADYRQALHKRPQIKILVELNGVAPNVIQEILERWGVLEKEQKPKEKRKKTVSKQEWTLDEVEYLLEKRKLGLTAEQIARDMGRTKGAIWAKLHDLRSKGKEIAKEIEAKEKAVVATAPMPEKIGVVERIARIAETFGKIVREIGEPEFAYIDVTTDGVCLKSAIGKMDILLEEKEFSGESKNKAS
ncbi:MAG: HTH domain-containing protein [Clostridia bacterium]|nr:HTH domain-containing protein [Clostridia bacterium]